MDSEQSAYASAQQKHNKYMVFGKKHRYIEVFQCSGEDMNLVLTGLHPTTNSTKPALLSPGMLSPAQHSPQSPPQQTHTIAHPPPSPLTLTIPQQSPSLIAQNQAAFQAQFIAHQNLLARQQSAAAAANAAAQHEYILLQNCGLLPPPPQQAAQAMTHQIHAQHHGHPGHHPQIILMQRPALMQPPAIGFLPTAHQWPTAYHHPTNHPALTTVSQLSGVMPSTVKRSYENAFQQDHGTVSSTKRHYSGHPAIYPHFYPPSV